VTVTDRANDLISGEPGNRPVVPNRSVALILVERVMTRAPRDAAFGDRYALAQCTGTFSYAAALAALKGYPADLLSDVEQRWSSVHGKYARPVSGSYAQALIGFWGMMALLDERRRSSLSATMDYVLEATQSYVLDGKVDDYAWQSLTRELPEIRQLPEQLGGVKERQIEPLRSAMSKLAFSEYIDRVAREFIAGMLLARFAQGSFEYLPTVVSMARQIPLSAFWFAVLAGSAKSSDVLSFSGSVGLLIKERLASDALAPPPPDIAFPETIIDSRLSRPVRHLSSGDLVVELLPGVVTRVRLPVEDQEHARDSNAVRRLSEEFQGLRRAVNSLLTRLDEIAPALAPSSNEQLDLLDKPVDGKKGRAKKKPAR
jgi:hypothetical protein